jgi:hypothetical protein
LKAVPMKKVIAFLYIVAVQAAFSWAYDTGSALTAPGSAFVPAPPEDRLSVTAKMASVVLPGLVNGILVTPLGLSVPTALYYAISASSVLGYAYTGGWEALGIGVSLESAALYSLATMAGDEANWWARQILWMSAGHAPMLAVYDVYSKLRDRVEPSGYRYPLKKVGILEAFEAPARLD